MSKKYSIEYFVSMGWTYGLARRAMKDLQAAQTEVTVSPPEVSVSVESTPAPVVKPDQTVGEPVQDSAPAQEPQPEAVAGDAKLEDAGDENADSADQQVAAQDASADAADNPSASENPTSTRRRRKTST